MAWTAMVTLTAINKLHEHELVCSNVFLHEINKVNIKGCTELKHLLTYLLTPWCRVLPEQLTALQLVKKFPAFHRTRRFITALTSVRHLSLSWASPIQSTWPHPTSWRSILILSTHLRLCLPSGLFPSGFPTKTLYAPLSSDLYLYLYKILNIMYVISTKAWYDNTEHEQTKTLCLQWKYIYTFSQIGIMLIKYRNFNLISDLIWTISQIIFVIWGTSCFRKRKYSISWNRWLSIFTYYLLTQMSKHTLNT